jgi:hypothetical protein
MEKYQYKYDVIIYEWTGDKNIISEITKLIENYPNVKIGLTDRDDVIFITQTDGTFTSTSYLYFGDYLVLDFNNSENILDKYNSDMINEKFKKL